MRLWTGERLYLSDIEEEEGLRQRERGMNGEWRSHERGGGRGGGRYSCASEEGRDEGRGGSRVRKVEGVGGVRKGGKEGEE